MVFDLPIFNQSSQPDRRLKCPVPECSVELFDFLREGEWELHRRMRRHLNYQHEGYYSKIRRAYWLRSRMRVRDKRAKGEIEC